MLPDKAAGVNRLCADLRTAVNSSGYCTGSGQRYETARLRVRAGNACCFGEGGRRGRQSVRTAWRHGSDLIAAPPRYGQRLDGLPVRCPASEARPATRSGMCSAETHWPSRARGRQASGSCSRPFPLTDPSISVVGFALPGCVPCRVCCRCYIFFGNSPQRCALGQLPCTMNAMTNYLSPVSLHSAPSSPAALICGAVVPCTPKQAMPGSGGRVPSLFATFLWASHNLTARAGVATSVSLQGERGGYLSG